MQLLKALIKVFLFLNKLRFSLSVFLLTKILKWKRVLIKINMEYKIVIKNVQFNENGDVKSYNCQEYVDPKIDELPELKHHLEFLFFLFRGIGVKRVRETKKDITIKLEINEF